MVGARINRAAKMRNTQINISIIKDCRLILFLFLCKVELIKNILLNN